MVLGLACLAYIAVKLGNIELLADNRYTLNARFVSASGLREGAFVEIGGVRVGTVTQIEFDPETYEAVIQLSLPSEVKLQEDAIASVRTSGIIGDKFIKLTPGGSETILNSGQEILETESSINLEELISKYIFESKKK